MTHPIPQSLRDDFSLIEDEAMRLGGSGVFTQMRTVTQSYFEWLRSQAPVVYTHGRVLRQAAEQELDGMHWSVPCSPKESSYFDTPVYAHRVPNSQEPTLKDVYTAAEVASYTHEQLRDILTAAAKRIKVLEMAAGVAGEQIRNEDAQ